MGEKQNQETSLNKISHHIEIINGEMGDLRDAQNRTNCDVNQIKTDLATVKTNVDWLMRFFWVIATASVGSLIAALFQIIK